MHSIVLLLSFGHSGLIARQYNLMDLHESYSFQSQWIIQKFIKGGGFGDWSSGYQWNY
jgi:hypothetical protein